MATRAQQAKELRGPALDIWEETKRVVLTGGGTMYIPLSFAPVSSGKEHVPKYLWRGEPGEGSVEVELLSYYRALRLTPSLFSLTVQERVAPMGGQVIGALETLQVSGYETLYHLFAAELGEPIAMRYGAFARILTRNTGILVAVTHADQERVDPLAKAILSTLKV